MALAKNASKLISSKLGPQPSHASESFGNRSTRVFLTIVISAFWGGFDKTKGLEGLSKKKKHACAFLGFYTWQRAAFPVLPERKHSHVASSSNISWLCSACSVYDERTESTGRFWVDGTFNLFLAFRATKWLTKEQNPDEQRSITFVGSTRNRIGGTHKIPVGQVVTKLQCQLGAIRNMSLPWHGGPSNWMSGFPFAFSLTLPPPPKKKRYSHKNKRSLTAHKRSRSLASS